MPLIDFPFQRDAPDDMTPEEFKQKLESMIDEAENLGLPQIDIIMEMEEVTRVMREANRKNP